MKRRRADSKAVDLVSPRHTAVERAVQAIRSGQVVGVPTETFYGLAVDPQNPRAVEQLYVLKGRPRHKPILLLISRISQLDACVREVPEPYLPLMKTHWPGPLTLVFMAKPGISPLLTGGTDTIGIRLTPHPLTRVIIEQLDAPITGTSANPAGLAPARTARQLHDYFGDKLGCIVDGGPAGEEVGSTVVSCVDGRLCLIRAGKVRLPGLSHCLD